ncbi:AAA-domain-containing protein [Dentipellis sp. KUC8613]|nr:AAA-domain-containing protein [Dentipellis sp. KUC8613]
MRSQFLLRRTRLPLKPSSSSSRALLSYSGPARYPRKENADKPSRAYRRSSSTTSPPVSNPNPSPSEPNNEGPSGTPEEPSKPKDRNKDAAVESKAADTAPKLPDGLRILWTSESIDPPSDPSALPPTEIFDEVLNNLYVTLHPQTQNRAAYTTPSGPPVEPTLALYCPIEGGDYIIDATVRELARQTGSDVVVLDAVHLAAGEWGQFGHAATALDLPKNPLHFPLPHQSKPRSPSWEDDDDDMPSMSSGRQMTLHVMAPMLSSKTPSAPSRSTTTKARTFFDQVINIASPDTANASSIRKPRLIYIRDFNTLASTSASWYAPLLAAVRQRRQGPLARPTSPVISPTTIIFGITPSITPPTSSSSSSGSGLSSSMNYLVSRPNSSKKKSTKSEWIEDEFSEKARERRLRERLHKWERGDAKLFEDLPKLSLAPEPSENSGPSGVVVIGPSGGMPGGLPFSLNSMMKEQASLRKSPTDPEDSTVPFFRTSVVVPAVRSSVDERSCRTARRQEINELTMRMGVGTVGGAIEGGVPPHPAVASSEGQAAEQGEGKEAPEEAVDMWEEWGKRVESWPVVRQIADQAVGSVVFDKSSSGELHKSSSLEPVHISWDVVRRSWAAQQASRDIRRAWMKKSLLSLAKEHKEDEDETKEDEEEEDEIVERVKNDPDLKSHEMDLLGSIVDSASMPTSFDQVHLSPHTIDSIRTIVSLPLLHPSAFKHGILKNHGMTGCLLFGPPGTGKTLVVRALAKEAGCRMLAIAPSDVMDMYVGEGEKLVRAVFSLARRLAPCVVFIDEIDALFGARSSGPQSGGAMAHRSIITEFMQEMDGLKTSREDNIIVIGATNRPFDLDDAVLRRLPRRLLIDLPGEKEREEILKILLRDEVLAPDVDYKDLAKKTETFSGSDLKHLCVSAALDAVKEHVEVPWASSSAEAAAQAAPKETEAQAVSGEPSTEPAVTATAAPSDSVAQPSEPEIKPVRMLHLRNFTKALKEITPSSSESLGSLADLRKWNEEFGEGRKKRKKQVWGKDRFGFTNHLGQVNNDARVSSASPAAIGPDISIGQ